MAGQPFLTIFAKEGKVRKNEGNVIKSNLNKKLTNEAVFLSDFTLN
jgi:hypothetical protein